MVLFLKDVNWRCARPCIPATEFVSYTRKTVCNTPTSSCRCVRDELWLGLAVSYLGKAKRSGPWCSDHREDVQYVLFEGELEETAVFEWLGEIWKDYLEEARTTGKAYSQFMHHNTLHQTRYQNALAEAQVTESEAFKAIRIHQERVDELEGRGYVLNTFDVSRGLFEM